MLMRNYLLRSNMVIMRGWH